MAADGNPAARNRSATRRLKPPRQQVVLRERELVLRSLDVARRGRLTLVLGPPGYGKTSALAQWFERLGQSGMAAAWYSATEAEREPLQFLRMLTLALEAAGIEPGPSARRAAGDASADALLDGLLLGLEQIREPLVLIIDDYDRIDQPAVARTVTELLASLPLHVNLVLGTRRKPSLEIATLRAMGGVRTIDPDELKFDGKDIAAILDLPPDAGELEAIQAQTEGWPVAVQLYRLWRERLANGAAMPAFGGHASEVGDYLAEQVVAALPAAQQKVLIALSIAEQVEPSFADAIREADDSAAMLEAISHALPSLVQQTAADGDIAYRVHPLLSDYARSRLMLEPGRAAVLHRRAALWLAAQARYVDAVRHAVQGKDEAFLLDLLGRLPFRSIFIAYGAGELRAILREVPPGALAVLPNMRLMQALALFKEGFFVEAEQLRREIETAIMALRTPDADALLVESRALGLLFNVHMSGTVSDCDAWIAWLEAHAPADPMTWAWCENVRIVVEQEQGRLAAAQASLSRTRRAFEMAQSSEFGLLQLIVHEMLIDLARGDLRAVQEQASVLMRRDPAGLVGERCLHAMGRMLSAEVDYQRSHRLQAADVMRMALAEYGRGEAWFDQYAIAMPVIVEVTFRRHGLTEARREIAAAARDYARRGMVCLEGMLAGVELSCLVRAGVEDGLTELADMCRARLSGPGVSQAPWRERDLLRRALAELALSRGQAETAQALAGDLVAEGTDGERLGPRVAGLLLSARAHMLAGQSEPALACLREAVLLASGEDMVAPFAEAGPEILAPLRQLHAGEPSRLIQNHIAAILRTIEIERRVADPDALSDREAEIVTHLADGASNKLIARRLGLTENTIKFHLKKVYAKLGVQTRKQAAARFLQDH
ncbi:LuxR C-terminal-related transcriptional regulator [Novosphingobium album (ex Hu et al. 2023)]|uniref:LuxR C-terminal-related transcriptional regulator n=1 Tax=Novosphingobium album (ex Hu et al. 2023) TaxID=2930093 RepID=A0ABT0B797_9SPHN|nr:LuxR C-terminal-related transcriptional regulator [Novosphingobium album (ex Hu et al. 2023)]MCJ2180951.1 LuxR C-terminal-related transcriptional regulator [Novosphingobium album (ex Hu et al. 2023)]